MDRDTRNRMVYEANRKEVLVAYLLWFFLGFLGAHRFYLGRVGTAVTQFALAVGGLILSVILIGFLLWFVLGIWVLLDAVLIPGMAREHNLALLRNA